MNRNMAARALLILLSASPVALPAGATVAGETAIAASAPSRLENAAAPATQAAPSHALTMHGEPALRPGPDGVLRPGGDAGPRRRGGRLTLGVLGAFDSLNPLSLKGMSAPSAIAQLTLQSLMRRALDEPFTLYPQLARAVELAPDLSAVTFHLDPRARFSDGAPVTADDVIFTFNLLKTHGRPNHRNAIGRVTAMKALGPHVLRLELAGNADRELPMILAMQPILPRHATPIDGFDQTGFRPIVGSGPYVIGSVRPGESVTFVRTPNWWGDAVPALRDAYSADEIRFDYFRDATAMFEAFKSGLIDLRIETDPRRWAGGYDIPAVRAGRIIREEAVFAAPKGMTGFVFNTRRAPFADIRVREALSFAFDFEWVNRSLYSGLYRRSDSYFADSRLSSAGRPADARERAMLAAWPDAVRPDILNGQWKPPASDGSGRDRANLQKAVTMLADAGYRLRDGVMRDRAGRPLAFEVMVTGREQERLALALQASLKPIGVRVRVRVVDSVQYERRRQTFDYDMIVATWLASPAPGNEQYFRWGSRAADQQASFNFAGARSPAIDALIGAIVSARDEADHVAAVRALDRVLLSGFYVIPLYYAPHVWLARWKHVERPDPLPLLGAVPETWSRADTSDAATRQGR